jgi:ABC-type uncharacterized transport system involved in gliding motility auxiliary subunit
MRRRGERLNLAAQLALVAAILVALNVLAARHFARIDLTADREYTLAPATREMLAGLDDIVSIEAHFSRNLPPYLSTIRTRVEDLLDEYRAYGGRSIQVRIESPGDDPATEQRMRLLGIPRVQLNVLERDQFQVTQVYMGMAIVYGQRKASIPIVEDLETLEYQISSAILKLTRKEALTVALAAGGDPLAALSGSGDGLGMIRRELERQYAVVDHHFGTGAPIPGKASVLMLLSPRSLSADDTAEIARFMAAGGKLLLLVDTFDLEPDGLGAVPLEHGLDALLDSWGVEIPRKAVADAGLNAPVSFSSGLMRFRLPYPYWPAVPREGFKAGHPVAEGLESLVLPWASPVLTRAGKPPGLTHTILATTSEKGHLASEPFDFSPAREIHESAVGQAGRQPLALLVEGTFPGGSARGAALIAGTSRFVRDENLEQFPANALLPLNAVDWMSQGGALIGIRTRGSSDRPLPELSERARTSIRFLNIFAAAGLLALIGMARLSLRRRRRVSLD